MGCDVAAVAGGRTVANADRMNISSGDDDGDDDDGDKLISVTAADATASPTVADHACYSHRHIFQGVLSPKPMAPRNISGKTAPPLV